ncbi:MAG: UDP-N-acetylglucosamine 1-carboxyvinyltransferase [Nitritalea sp.]
MIKDDIVVKIKGGQTPNGKVKVSGAKNSATRLLAASLIADDVVTLRNFPTELVDANYKYDFITKSGGEITVDRENETINISSINIQDILLENYEYPIRTTYLFAAGIVKRCQKAKIPYPGGCKIGNRGYDMHIMVWERLGAQVIEHDDYIQVITRNGFEPGDINFPISTIGGTENALICASTISGKTTISNAYISPEVNDLINFLKSLGVKIVVVGNSYIEVEGSESLKGSNYRVMPDRIEVITWLVYGALSRGSILIEDVPFEALEIPLKHIKESGIDFFNNSNSIFVSQDSLTNGIIQPFELATGTHPGIISDMQPFYVLLGLYANGISRVFDYRYPKRTKYCDELSKLYPGRLQWEDGKITTYGSMWQYPEANIVYSTDLRGSMSLILGGLLCEKGETVVVNAEMALRGYNKLVSKLSALGVEISVLG